MRTSGVGLLHHLRFIHAPFLLSRKVIQLQWYQDAACSDIIRGRVRVASINRKWVSY